MTITDQKFNGKRIGLVIFLFIALSFSAFNNAEAQSGPPPGLVCDPLPADDNLLNQCIFWIGAGAIRPPSNPDPAIVCNPRPTDPVMLANCIVFGYIPPQPVTGSSSAPTTAQCVAPTDSQLIADCVLYGFNPRLPAAPGTNPNPIPAAGAGTWGQAGAYNSVSNTYLVVSTNAGGAGLVASIYSAQTHTLVGTPFAVAGDASQFTGAPRVVYNPATNQYLVAWEDNRDGANNRFTYGQLINGDGTLAGGNFPINTSSHSFFNDLEYDSVNNRFVATFDNSGGQMFVVPVGANGAASPPVTVSTNQGVYQGQNNLVYNSTLNEYWMMYTQSQTIPAPGGGRPEDNSIWVQRYDANMQPVGQPVRVSQPNPGVLIGSSFGPTIGQQNIAYCPGVGTMVVWMDASRTGVMGRMLYDDGTTGEEFEAATLGVDYLSYGYWAPSLTCNPYDNTFYMSTQDGAGGVLVTRFGNGVRITSDQVLGGPRGGNGTFWPTTFNTPTGVIVLGSYDYGQTMVGTLLSPGYTPRTPLLPEPPGPPSTPVDPQEVGTLISQIYLYSLGAAGVLALIMMIIGGYYVMTAGGNAAQATRGKEFIYSSLVGLALLLASYFILSTINPDLTSFDLSSFSDFNL